MLFKRRICVFKEKNRFKFFDFTNEKKALRFWCKCRRKGWDAQIIY